MAKSKTIYSCTECGGSSPKWQGQCTACNAWNTLVESIAEKPGNHRFESLAPTAKLLNLSEIEARETDRIPTGIGEFDRALGVVMVAGFAKEIGVQVGDLVAANDECFRVLGSKRTGLGDGETQCCFFGCFTGECALVDLRTGSDEGNLQALQQFAAERRTGGQDNLSITHGMIGGNADKIAAS